MKEYKTVTLKIDSESQLDNKLNEYVKKGWFIMHVNTISMDYTSGCCELIYLFEREKPDEIRVKKIPPPPRPPPSRKITEGVTPIPPIGRFYT